MKLSETKTPEGAYYLLFCPACKELHAFTTPPWTFDGNFQAPTVRNSILTRAPGKVCHLFLTAGRLEYLSDCSHELAGKTVDLPDLPEWAL